MTATFFAKIDSWWKALGVLVAAIALGVTIGAAAVSFFALPAVVEANAAAIKTNEARISAVEAQQKADGDTAERNQLALEHRLDRVECLVIAGRRGTPIEDCL